MAQTNKRTKRTRQEEDLLSIFIQGELNNRACVYYHIGELVNKLRSARSTNFYDKHSGMAVSWDQVTKVLHRMMLADIITHTPFGYRLRIY